MKEVLIMVRTKHCRLVDSLPESVYFKPRGIPLRILEEIILTVDEFEAIRLADLVGFYQEQAAEKMGVSRQTFGRIIKSAHRKVTEVLVQGKALKIEGGNFEIAKAREVVCQTCQYSWNLPSGTGKPESCPVCGNANIHTAQVDKECDGALGIGKRLCCRENQQKK
jgi:predicted DNA-binding protein (UPF0251 family)